MLANSFGHFGILKNCCCRKKPFGYCLSYLGGSRCSAIPAEFSVHPIRQTSPAQLNTARLSCLFAHCSGFSINDLHRELTVVHAHVAMGDWEAIGGGRRVVIGGRRDKGICKYRSSNPISNGTCTSSWTLPESFDCAGFLFVLLTSTAAYRTRKSLLKIITMLNGLSTVSRIAIVILMTIIKSY